MGANLSSVSNHAGFKLTSAAIEANRCLETLDIVTRNIHVLSQNNKSAAQSYKDTQTDLSFVDASFVMTRPNR